MNIGIDLGTTFSAVATCCNGEPSVVLNNDGDFTTPSVVLFEDDGSVTVGTSAKERGLLEPDKTISTVKDFMGTNKLYDIGGKTISPEEVSALILKKLVQDVQEQLSADVDGVVVTIPAYFTDAQRKSTEDACTMAGINLIGMINEPTAAALCYLNERECTHSNVLVYDLGGGTFDVSIVAFDDNKSTVIATGGIRKLGGHFFDQQIVDYVVDYFIEKYDLDLYEDEYLDVLQELIIKAENCKIRLSNSPKSDIILRIDNIKEKITITKEQFEDMIDKFYKRTESCIRMVLSDANMTFSDIDKIVLVGGSSRIPYIKRCLKEFSGIEPSSDINPDEAVALGAALFADKTSLKVQDVCSHSLGLVVLDNTGIESNTIIIKRNSPLPISESKQFVVPSDGIDTIVLELTEGEDKDVEYVTRFSTIEIELPASAKGGTNVIVKFDLDNNQLLHVFATIKCVPEISKKINIDRKSNMTTEELTVKKSALALTMINN